MPQSLDEALGYSQRWIEIIHKAFCIQRKKPNRSLKNLKIIFQNISTKDGWNTENR